MGKEWNPAEPLEQDDEITTPIVANLSIVVGADKQQGRSNHETIVEELSTISGMKWVYTDASRTNGRNGLVWAWATADYAIDQSSGTACIGELDIVTCEMMPIHCTMTEGIGWGMKNITIFSDCRPAVLRIGGLKLHGGDRYPQLAMQDVMNRFDEIRIVWIPGHCGIAGNHWADRMAKSMIGGRIDYGRWDRWRMMHRMGGGLEMDLRKKEVLEWTSAKILACVLGVLCVRRT